MITRLATAGLLALAASAGHAGTANAVSSEDHADPDAPANQPTEQGGVVQVVRGVAPSLPDPSLGVPKVLELGILPLGTLADAAGQEGYSPYGDAQGSAY